ncbi:MAG: alpha/beta hydrolase, partial [Nocardioidaceae bacterium]|nr:alpha/beta hydrolase [Nocardioidaceae bacterium]
MNRHLRKDLDGGTARRSSKRSAHRPARRAAMTSLALSGALAVTAAVLTPSATAEVTADREGAAGRTAAIVPFYDLNYNSAADPRTCVPPKVAPEDPGFCLDLFAKDTNRSKPLVVIIHGGGWIADASRRSPRFVRVAKDFAKAGYVALIMDYPKASDVPRVVGTTMQEDAVEQAVAWAKANRLTYKIDPSKVSFIGGSSGGQMSLLAAFNANQAKPGKITMAYSLSGPVDMWKDINALQTKQTLPNAKDEGPPGYRNIELYLGCDWDGFAAPKCQEAQAKAVSPLFYGKDWTPGAPGIDSSCPLVRITRARGANPPEDLPEVKALDDALAGRGCRVTATSV